MSFGIKFTRQWASGTRVTSPGLPSDPTCILKAEPGKLDIKIRKPGILFYQFTHWFTLQTSEYDFVFDFGVDSASLATSFIKCNVIMTR